MWDNGIAQVMKIVLQIIIRPWTKTVKLQSPSLQPWRMQEWPQKMTWKVWGIFCLCFLLSFFIWSKTIRKINICSSPTCTSHARRPMVLTGLRLRCLVKLPFTQYWLPHSPVQHLSAGPLQLRQDLRELGVIITGRAPAENTGQVIPCPQGQHT